VYLSGSVASVDIMKLTIATGPLGYS
jgi:hypothetical protein